MKHMEYVCSSYHLKALCYTRVKIGAPRINKQAPQCLDCQNYGYTDHTASITPDR